MLSFPLPHPPTANPRHSYLPSPMESLRSERRTTARHKREPLANLTNARPLSSSAARCLLKPKPAPKPRASDPPKSSLSSNLDVVPVKSSSSIGSSDPDNPRDGRISTSGLPTTEISTKIDVADATSCREPKHSMNHVRQSADKRKDKGKAVSFSCPPVERTKRIGGKLKMAKEGVVLPGTFSVPHQKTRKKQCYTTSYNAILQEPVPSPKFIEDQRAYFAEIDAFDLAEEVVSESELE